MPLTKKRFPGQFDPSKDRVFIPDKNHVFVFGSNLAGAHGGGAAAMAHRKYGAEMGKGEGLQGVKWKTLSEYEPNVDDYGDPILLKRSVFNGFKGEKGCGSYALPTKGFDLETLPLVVIEYFVIRMVDSAITHPSLEYFVTRVGCGLGGWTDTVISKLFQNIHADEVSNIILPMGW